jgi:poly(beta-D-mannuronate) lyase
MKFNSKIIYLFIFLCTILIGKVYSQENKTYVKDIAEFNKAMKKSIPGSIIILNNGIWENIHLKVRGTGKKEQPIVIKAETAGKVIISGDSKLTIAGKYITVDGLWFKDGAPTSKSIISFKENSKSFANNCRLTNCVISYYNPDNDATKSHWVDIWGKNNRVDHNNFTGKTNEGTTLVVWLKGEEHIKNKHQIDHNFFGKRPELGRNGGETIRIGTSDNSMKSSMTTVENNTFKNCDGEIEIISNKSGDNIYRNNLFLASKGTLTLRHGNNALVEGNVFLGNNLPRTGGIRIINENHIVRNNLLVGIKGDGFRGPIVIMNGVPNSPLNRYNQVKNVDIQNNTLINCTSIELAAGKDSERSLPPTNTLFANNLITNTNGNKILVSHDDISGINFQNNIVDSEAIVNGKQFKKESIVWGLLRSLPMPDNTNTSLSSTYKNGKSPQIDIVGNKKTTNIVGAFNLGNTIFPIALRSKTGPYWKPIIIAPKKVIKKITIEVEPGINTLNKAIKKATNGTTIKLKDGIYFVGKTLKIKGSITVKGNGKSTIKGSDNLPKALNYFFRVETNSKLILENIIFDGDNDTKVKYAVVSPDKNNSELYNLYINNCTFKNFNNKKGGSIFKAYIGTKADTINIANSKLINSYRGLNLGYEKDGKGTYNAKTVIIYNTVFKNIKEFAIKYTKSGFNLNDFGGKLLISNSIFSKVANNEKGTIIIIKGIPFLEIRNTVLENSYLLKTPISLSGIQHKIENSLVNNCGKIKISRGAKKNNVVYKSPKWGDKKLYIPSKKSYLLKENNKIERIGLIQK